MDNIYMVGWNWVITASPESYSCLLTNFVFLIFWILNHISIGKMKGERVLEGFNIQREAGGSKRALVKTLEANVTNTIMEIHFLWAGRGTCCIPFQSTYGPLVSAIHAYQGSDQFPSLLFFCFLHDSIFQISTHLFLFSSVSDETSSSSESNKKRIGKVVGIVVGCAGGVVIISSIFYLWWKKEASGHTRVQTESPRKWFDESSKETDSIHVANKVATMSPTKDSKADAYICYLM